MIVTSVPGATERMTVVVCPGPSRRLIARSAWMTPVRTGSVAVGPGVPLLAASGDGVAAVVASVVGAVVGSTVGTAVVATGTAVASGGVVGCGCSSSKAAVAV